MKVTCLGGAKTVTGSSFLLDAGGDKVLVDCGMFQGRKELRQRNTEPFLFNPAEIDYVLLTHAHIDHSGLIPRLVQQGFRGKILTTSATLELVKIMLPDSGHIQEMEAEWANRKARRAGNPETPPLYSVEDALKSLEYFQEVDYDETYPLSPRIAVRFTDAGHILGSSIIEVFVTEEEESVKVVFSGDLGKSDQPIIRDPFVVEEADFVFMEATYGARLHEDDDTKLVQLAEIINSTALKGGNVVIPSFAVGRTQEILYYLNKLVQEGKITPLPIYIDSPLAISATEIFSRHPESYDVRMRRRLKNGEDPFNFPQVTFTLTADESRALNGIKGGAIIISASGMADAGRIKHHLKHNLWRPESTILMVGYQAEGTLGRRLINGEKKVRIFGEEISVQAKVLAIHGFSAHADQAQLLKWLKDFINPPRQVFLVHGEEESMETLSGLIEDTLNIPVHIPEYQEEILLGATEKFVRKERKISLHLKSEEILSAWQEAAAAVTDSLEKMLCEGCEETELVEAEKMLQELSAWLEGKLKVIQERRGAEYD